MNEKLESILLCVGGSALSIVWVAHTVLRLF